MIFALALAAYGIIGLIVFVLAAAFHNSRNPDPIPPSGLFFIVVLWPLYVAARIWEAAWK